MAYEKKNKRSRGNKGNKAANFKDVPPSQQHSLGNVQNIYHQTTCTQKSRPMSGNQDINTAGNSTCLQEDAIVPESSLMTEFKTREHTPFQKDERYETTERSSSEPKTSTKDLRQNTTFHESTQAINRPVTPSNPIPHEEMFSPNTLNEIRHTIRTLFPKGPPKPPPVIPVKRHKKSDTPYIVGCMKRKRVPECKSLKCFKGDDYGITKKTNAFDDEDASLHTPTKRSRITYNRKLSKSRFNPQSDEIAARLKLNDKVDELLPKSYASETNSFMSKPYFSRPPTFSPVPSTSKDNETILNNEKHFLESLHNSNDDFTISDDEELPVVMVKAKQKEEKHVSLLQDENLNTINIPSPTIIGNIVRQINSSAYMEKEIDFVSMIFKSKKPENDTKPDMSISPIVTEEKIYNKSVIENEPHVVNKSSETIDSNEKKVALVSPGKNKMVDLFTPSSEVPSISPTAIEIPDVAVNTNKVTRSYSWQDDVEIISETLPHIIEIPDPTEHAVNTEQVTLSYSWQDYVEIVSESFPDRQLNTSSYTDVQIVEGDFSSHPSSNIGSRQTRETVSPDGTTYDNAVPSMNGQPPTAAHGERYIGDCPICFDNILRNSVASTTCGHVFCLGCLERSIKINGKRCPTCRKVLKGTGYHQIFV